MPRHVITDAQVTLNGVVLSNRVKKVTIQTAKRAPAPVTAMGDVWDENVLVDVRNWKASFDFYADYSTGSVWSTIQGIFTSTGTSGVTMVVRPTTGIRTSDNPEFSGQILLDGQFPVIDADYGAVHMNTVTFLGTGALSQFTSSS